MVARLDDHRTRGLHCTANKRLSAPRTCSIFSPRCRSSRSRKLNAKSFEKLAEDMKLDFIDLSPHIGTEVRGPDLSRPMDKATIEALRKVWLDRALLVFRGQKLSQQALVRFTRYFGESGERAPSTNTAYAKAHMLPEIMLVSNVRENG